MGVINSLKIAFAGALPALSAGQIYAEDTPWPQTMDDVLVSPFTESLIGEEVLSFLDKQAQAGHVNLPRAIITELDTMLPIAPEFFEFGYIPPSYDRLREHTGEYLQNVNEMITGSKVNDVERLSLLVQFQFVMSPAFAIPYSIDNQGGLLALKNSFYDNTASKILPSGDIPYSVFSDDPQDWTLFYLLHEQGHLNHFVGHKTASEYMADTEFHQLYYLAYKDNITKNAEFPYALRAFRSMSAIMRVNNDVHNVTAIAPLPHEREPLNHSEIIRADEQIKDAKAQLYSRIDVPLDFKVEVDITEKIGILQTILGKETDPRQGRLDDIDALIEHRHFDDAHTALELFPLTPDEDIALTQAVNARKADKENAVSQKYLNSHPAEIYKQAQAMLANGSFNDNPAGHRLFEVFVDGAARYVPDIFNVPEDDQPHTTPGIVTKLARRYAPATAPIYESPALP